VREPPVVTYNTLTSSEQDDRDEHAAEIIIKMDQTGIPFYIFASLIGEEADSDGRIDIGTFLRNSNAAYP
jgi:hypothetical protein